MILFTTTFRRAVTTSAVTLATICGPALTAISQSPSVTLNGAGATFPKPLYDRYFSEFTKKNTNIQVNYEGIGSGGGIKQLTAGTVDFAGSDAAMTDAQIDAVKQQLNKDVVMIPTAGGAVVVVYNLPGVNNLKLSRSVLPGVFLGQITRWNDSKIAKDNPGVNLPDRPIKTVVRADGSGTSYIFTNHLSAISPEFKTQVGTNTTPNWSGNPLKGKGNPGVAALVKQTEGSVGYVEYAYAKQNDMTTAQVQDKNLKFIPPSLEAANKALATVSLTTENKFRAFEGDPKEGYPIVGMTWLLIYKQYDADKAVAIKSLVNWILTDGQAINKTLDYTSVPQDVAARVREAVTKNVATR